MHFPSIIAEKFGIGFKSLSNFWKVSCKEAIYCAAAEMLQFMARELCSGRAGAAGNQHPHERVTHRRGNRAPTFALIKTLKPTTATPKGYAHCPQGFVPESKLTDAFCLRGESCHPKSSLIKQLGSVGACCTPNSHLTIGPGTGVWKYSEFNQ